MGVRIFFYLPDAHLPSPERREAWLRGEIPNLLAGGKSASAQSWIFQSWAELRSLADIELVGTLPESGLIVTLSNFLPTGFRASPEQFVAAVVADYLPHPGAQVQIVQNLAHARRLPGSVFMPHWPQPNLIPRDPARGGRVETVAFFGDPANLAPEVSGDHFARALAEQTGGARLEVREHTRWHDYSDVDVILALRGFTRARHINKPATKLYNAWLAGVPFIGGSDSAYAAEGVAGQDFLVADSPNSCLAHIGRLRANPAEFAALVAAGHRRAEGCSRAAVRARWLDLCTRQLPALHAARKTKSPIRRAFEDALGGGLYYLDKKLRS
jgi:hypothetical protein